MKSSHTAARSALRGAAAMDSGVRVFCMLPSAQCPQPGEGTLCLSAHHVQARVRPPSETAITHSTVTDGGGAELARYPTSRKTTRLQNAQRPIPSCGRVARTYIQTPMTY